MLIIAADNIALRIASLGNMRLMPDIVVTIATSAINTTLVFISYSSFRVAVAISVRLISPG